MITEIIVAIVTGLCSFGGSFLAFNKNTALISYRLEQLEKKFEDNDVTSRLLKIEMRLDELEKETGKN